MSITLLINYRQLYISVIKVPLPALRKPSDEDLFLVDGAQRRVNHDYLKNHFIREGRLKEQHALYIIEQATNIMLRECNMVNITSPVTSECLVFLLQQLAQHQAQYVGIFADNTLEFSSEARILLLFNTPSLV